MKIYTKTGDRGETSLFGAGRVSKDALRIEAYGTVDELNSFLGVVRSLKPPSDIEVVLLRIQNDLFVLGADLATPHPAGNANNPRIEARHAEELEPVIDGLESKLRPLKAFILPGGSTLGAQLHLARTVCRRAERCVVKLAKAEDIGTFPITYLNRLSDLLFVLARYANQLDSEPETEWHPK